MLHLSRFDSFIGYTLISSDMLIVDIDGEYLFGGEHICLDMPIYFHL